MSSLHAALGIEVDQDGPGNWSRKEDACPDLRYRFQICASKHWGESLRCFKHMPTEGFRGLPKLLSD